MYVGGGREMVLLVSCLPNRFKAKRTAGAGEVDCRDFHVLAQGNRSGGEQRLFAVEGHPQRAIGEARRHSGRARAAQVVGICDFDDDAVVKAVGVRGDNRQTCLDRQPQHEANERGLSGGI